MFWLTITGILIIIAALAIALLLFPITISAISNKDGKTVEGNFSISWLILKIRYSLKDKKTDVLFFNRKISTLQDKEKKHEPNKTKESTGVKKSRKSPPIKYTANLAGPLLRLFQKLLNIPRFRNLDIEITYGLDDPAFSGILTGVLHSVISSSRMRHNFRFNPDFTKPLLDWNLMILATITPIQIFPPIVRFATNKDVLRFGWVMIRS